MKSENLSSKDEIKKNDPLEANKLQEPEEEEFEHESYKKTASGLGFSGAWMKHLFHKNIVIPVITLLGFFLFIHLPVILGASSPEGIAEYAKTVIRGTNFGVMMIVYYLSVAASVLAFDYLHTQESATNIHMMPFTRGKLFRTSVLTGYLMLLIPILLAAGSMFALYVFSPNVAASYNLINCVKWTIDTVVAMTFAYSIANLAGIISGSTLIHVLMAFFLDALPGTLILLIKMYQAAFLTGVSTSFDFVELNYLSPSTHYLARDYVLTVSDLKYSAVYMGVALALTIIAGLLYKKVKLERERSTTVFPLLSDILVMFFTFLTISGFSMVFSELIRYNMDGRMPKNTFVITAFASSIVFFIIFRMIGDGTVRIFNFRNLVKYIVFLIVAAGIFAVTVYDVTGIQKKIPAASDVKNVNVEIDVPFGKSVTLTRKESIAKALDLHKESIAHIDDFQRENADGYVTIKLDYTLKSGGTLKRVYEVSNSYREGSPLDPIIDKVDILMADKDYLASVTSRIEGEARSSKDMVVLPPMVDDASATIPEDLRQTLIKKYMYDFGKNGFKYHFRLKQKAESSAATYTKNGVATIVLSSGQYDPYNDDFGRTDLVFGAKDVKVSKFMKKYGFDKTLLKQEKNVDGGTTDA